MRTSEFKLRYLLSGLCLAMMVLLLACKQDFLEGAKTFSNGKVYFPEIAGGGGLVAGMVNGELMIDTSDHTANFSIPVFRGGFGDTSTFEVETVVDNSLVDALISAGSLPNNTEALQEELYSLNSLISVSFKDGIMQGVIQPKINIEQISRFAGKTLALGLVLKSSSKFTINEDMNHVVLYFDVDSLIDEAVPAVNLLDPTAWEVLHIASNDDVKFTVNVDGSILVTGGNGGHQGVFQAVEVQGGKDYTIDLNVKGGGAVDTWYEVYVADKQPIQGQDYTNEPGDINRLALNTWSGCGVAPFDGALSSVGCGGSGKVVHMDVSGTIYIVIKSGGVSMGPDGILATDIDFRKVQ